MPATTAEDEKRERRTRAVPELAQTSTPGAGGEADGVGETAAAASRSSFTFPEWQKSIEATRNLFAAALRDGLKLAASSLHDQATFLKTLADSKTPSELLKCHVDFAEQSWSKSFSEGSKMLDHLKHSHQSAVS
ncbi:phasin family protein [Bradyrhizobium sp. USDA 10063]